MKNGWQNEGKISVEGNCVQDNRPKFWVKIFHSGKNNKDVREQSEISLQICVIIELVKHFFQEKIQTQNSRNCCVVVSKRNRLPFTCLVTQ